MAIKRAQRTVLTLATLSLLGTLLLFWGMAPYVTRGNPMGTMIALVVIELLVFATAFWVAGKGIVR
ncbi:MAG TPA: hypothetical protein V6D05_09390 [Stenomitos sp.]